MDVIVTQGSTSAATPAVTPPTSSTLGATSTGAPLPGSSQTTPPATSAVGSQTAAAVLPLLGSSSTNPGSTSTARQQSGIAPAIAKLFGTGGGAPTPIPLNVSYKVDGDFIVTIFTDPKTGQEITQLPPEILIGLAQFFDQQDGVTLDHNA